MEMLLRSSHEQLEPAPDFGPLTSGEAMTVPPVPPEVPAIDFGAIPPAHLEAPAPGKSRKNFYFGLGGLALGLVVGLLLGAIGGAVGNAVASSSAIPDAVESCSAADTTGVDVMDEGKSLNLQTSGEESAGTDVVTVVCVLNELDAPDSIFTKLESTRALDGTQSTEWSGYTASWTYHPDNGLNIIVETAAK
jgi:hypothetical protein